MIVSCFGGLVFSPLFLPLPEVLADTTPTSVTVAVSGPVCGDGVCNGSETCSTCPADCGVCGGGGGGGGGSSDKGEVYVPPAVVTKVIIQGKAYPSSIVTLMKDGKVTAITRADSLANFRAEITDITPGIWTFGVRADDSAGKKSVIFNFTTSVTAEMTTTVNNIVLSPTIDLEKNSLQEGEILNIFGQTAPQSEVSIIVNSPQEITKKTTAGPDGVWSYAFDTGLLEEGSYITRAKAATPEGLLSAFSQALVFTVGKAVVKEIYPRSADINKDKEVNLVDFSILLYNWGLPKNIEADLNGDGKVNLVDFSMMLYYWTG